MAEIKLNDINSAMETFLKKADEVKLKKKDLMDNMPQLLQAIKMFDRLQELYNSVTDKDSPRAKNYFNLAQQIASINEGWQNAHQQVSREAFLADKEGAGFPNRLSKEESEQLKKLMQSSKLKDFVEFLDMESPQTYEKFKGIVLQEAESMVGTKIVKDALRDYYLATSSDISKSNLSLREWLSVKLADFIENINKDSEDDSDKSSGNKSVRASAEDETLIQDEEERQEKVKTDQSVAEIVKTSGKIDSALRKREPEKSKTKVKVKSKPWRAPKGTWMDDLVQLLKWAGYLAGGIAAVAGLSNIIVDQIKRAREQQDLLKKNLDEYIKERRADQARAEGAVTDKEAASKHMNKMLSDLKETRLLPNNVSSSDITMFQSWATMPGNRKDLRKWIAEQIGSEDPEYLAILEAIARKQSTAFVPRTGSHAPYSLWIDPNVPDPESQISDAAMYTYGVEAKRRQIAWGTVQREQWDSKYDAKNWGVARYVGIPYVLEGFRAGGAAVRNWFADTYGDLDSKQIAEMSDSDLEKYALDANQKRWEKQLLRGGYIRDVDYDPQYSVGTFHGVPDVVVGEVIHNSTNREFAKLRKAQQSGDPRQVYDALKQTLYWGNRVGSFEDEQKLIGDILSYKDWGSDEGFVQNTKDRTRFYDPSGERRQPQTVVNNYSTTQFNSYEMTDKTQDGIN